jgi:hypothetical protein
MCYKYIMSQVFTSELVSDFVSKLTAPPPNVKIMTRDEFFSWWMPNEWKPVHATRGVTEGSKFFNATYKQQIVSHLKDIAFDFGTNRISDVCVSGSITPDYVATTFGDLLMEDPEYDAMFAVHNPDDGFESTLGPLSIEEKLNRTLEHKMKKILGFFFSQKGECRDAPNVICVNLICIKKDPVEPLQPIKGALLFGAAMYCIKNNSDIQKTVYLELAYSYANPAGLNLYSSFGFVPDLNLYAGKCFSNLKHLPMSVNLKGVNNGKIVGVVNGDKYPSKTKNVRNYLAITDRTEQTEKGKELKKHDMLILGRRVVTKRDNYARKTRRKGPSSESERPYHNIDIDQLKTIFSISDAELGIEKRSRGSSSSSGPGRERSRSRERVRGNSTRVRGRS